MFSRRGKDWLDIKRLLKKRGKINLRNDGIRRVGYSCRSFSFFFPLISLTTKTKSQNNNCMINSHVFLHGISSKTGITPIMILISSLAFWWFPKQGKALFWCHAIYNCHQVITQAIQVYNVFEILG